MRGLIWSRHHNNRNTDYGPDKPQLDMSEVNKKQLENDDDR